MHQWHMKDEKEWRLRARLTHVNKAMRGCDKNPGENANAMKPLLETEKRQLQEELQRRRTTVTV